MRPNLRVAALSKSHYFFSGSFILEVDSYSIAGWYDGSGITSDTSQAFQVVVADAEVEGIDIALPVDPRSLLCPSGAVRSQVTGQCD